MKLFFLILTSLGLAGCFGPKTPQEQVAAYIEATAPKIDNSTPEGAFNSFVRLSEYAANLEDVSNFTFNLPNRQVSLSAYLSDRLQPLDQLKEPPIPVKYSGSLLKTLVDGETQKRYEFEMKNITPIPKGLEKAMRIWEEERTLGLTGVVTLNKTDNRWTISSMSVLLPSAKGDFNELQELLPRPNDSESTPSTGNLLEVRGVL